MRSAFSLCGSCVVLVVILAGIASAGGYGSSGGSSHGGSTRSAPAAGYGSAGGGSTRSAPPAGYGSAGGSVARREVVEIVPEVVEVPAPAASRSVVQAPAPGAAPAPVSAPAPVAAPPDPAEARGFADGGQSSPVVRYLVREFVEVDAPPPAPACESGQCGVTAPGQGEQPDRLIRQYRDARKEMHETQKAARLEHQSYRHGRRANAEATQRNAVQAARDAYRAAKE
jgi:hypothetical protein